MPHGPRQPDSEVLVRRIVDEVMNAGRLDVLAEIYTLETVAVARRWIRPFREGFPDVRMQIVTLVTEDDAVAARFRCSATLLGSWRRHEPTGRRFRNVDEVYFFAIRDGRTASAWGLEDDERRRRQLGL